MTMTAWKGGEIPVSRYADVKVRFGDGATDTGSAGSYDWSRSASGLASGDIVAYEVLGAAPVEVAPPGTPWIQYDGSGMPPFVGNPMVRVRTSVGVQEPRLAGHLFWDRVGLPPVIASAPATTSPLPVDAKARKALPVFSGFVRYFPDAMVEVAELSRVGNDQHNPGKPLFWDRSKSGDELDALTRHLIDAGTFDNDGVRHSTKVAWRAMANLQKEIERSRGEAS